MRVFKMLAAVALMFSFGAVQACPDQPSNQTQSTKAGKPLAPKPAV